MDDKSRLEARQATERLRRPPSEPRRIQLSFDSGGKLGEQIVPAPAELALEATNAEGELAAWFHDGWWTEVIERWGDDPVTIHISPTASALLHMVVLHQLEMIRRVAPTWRIVGHAYRDDLSDEDAIDRLACSPYDEIRVIDQTRHSRAPSGQSSLGTALNEIFGRIRREQTRAGTTRPILVRLPAGASKLSSGPVATHTVDAAAG